MRKVGGERFEGERPRPGFPPESVGLFLAVFREAAERLKAGDRTARFPNGCFPPGLPFVRA